MAIEYAPYGIRVNAIGCGTVDTPIVHRSAAASGDPDRYWAMLRDNHPIGRIASPDEVAEFLHLHGQRPGQLLHRVDPDDGRRVHGEVMIYPSRSGIGSCVSRLPSALLSVALTSILACASHAQEITVDVRGSGGRTVSRHLTGACIEDVNHEIYGGIYSQMIFGESFQEPPPAPAMMGFKTFGGRWLVDDGAVRIDAADGPKLVSDRAAFQGWRDRRRAEVRRPQGAKRRLDRSGRPTRRRRRPVHRLRGLARPGTSDGCCWPDIATTSSRSKTCPATCAVGRWIPLEVRLSGSVIEISWTASRSCGTTTASGPCPRGPSDCEPGSARRVIATCG